MVDEHPADAKSDSFALLRRLFTEHARVHIWSYVMSIALMGVGAAATAGSAYLLKPVLNHMVEGEGFSQLRALSWLVAALFALRGLATYGYLVILSRTGNRIVADVQHRIFEKLIRQDLRFYQDRHSSEFMTRLAVAAGGIRDSMQVLITSTGRDLLTLIGLVIVMIVQDPLMSLIALSTFPIAVLALGRTIRRVRKFARRSFDGSSQILQTLQESILGIKIVKSFNLQSIMQTRMNVSIREVERSANRMASSSAIASPLADALAGFAIAAVIFYGSWRVTIAHADAGSFFSFVAALLMAYDPAKRIARVNVDIQNGLVGARLAYEILDAPASEDGEAAKPALVIQQGRIAFEQVDFAYRAGEPILAGLDLVVEPNQTTALVGPSGGGKSTIVALIQRFYEPDAGRILIDGQVISQHDLHSLRAKIAYVAQDVFLFRGTVRDNIALGRPGASDDEIMTAARKANAHEFITGFPNGYDTPVGEQGAQLSGGQRQRIAIARAMLKDAPILLLDEPTAALDSESEREVQKALDALRVGRTTLVVAHRLQTIINADRICVVEGGRAVEHGTHAELMERRGTYHSFFATQFGAQATNGRAVGADISLDA